MESNKDPFHALVEVLTPQFGEKEWSQFTSQIGQSDQSTVGLGLDNLTHQKVLMYLTLQGLAKKLEWVIEKVLKQEQITLEEIRKTLEPLQGDNQQGFRLKLYHLTSSEHTLALDDAINNILAYYTLDGAIVTEAFGYQKLVNTVS